MLLTRPTEPPERLLELGAPPELAKIFLEIAHVLLEFSHIIFELPRVCLHGSSRRDPVSPEPASTILWTRSSRILLYLPRATVLLLLLSVSIRLYVAVVALTQFYRLAADLEILAAPLPDLLRRSRLILLLIRVTLLLIQVKRNVSELSRWEISWNLLAKGYRLAFPPPTCCLERATTDEAGVLAGGPSRKQSALKSEQLNLLSTPAN
ncbi:hypothetical protein ZWY2020_039641 [Hordeum vulgare]|nr:hypothetical protein ZWY2020_039641 [Hordeum vulgare]